MKTEQELMSQKAELTQELTEVEITLRQLREEVQGKYVDPRRYRDVCAEQSRLGQRKLKIQGLLSVIRAEMGKIYLGRTEANKTRPKIVRVGGLDEYDLSNALMEPQGLLQRAYDRLSRITATYGRTDEDRGLLDTLHDYLYRNGLVLDRGAMTRGERR